MRDEAGISPIEIDTDFIKLDSFLKYCGAAGTGGHAKLLIADGEVLVGGEPCLMRGKKLRPGDLVECGGSRYEVRARAH